jgi:membrane-anchored glycerophosphoryl diester phosphodiesterase (GDPDase)
LLSSDVVFVVFVVVVVVLVVAVLFWGGDDLGTVVFKGADKFSFLFWEIKEGFVWKLCMLRSLSERATVAILFWIFFFFPLCVCVFWILVGKESKNLEEERLEARSLFMASINR